ncbi:MAG: thiamine-phosphate synthase family protein [candidate division WOR-3 bacterium]
MRELVALTKAVRELEKLKKFTLLMPEVRVNFAYAKINPKTVRDVAAVDGRITVVNRMPKAAGKIKFGASDHLARILIEISRYDKSIRSAINFKFSREIYNRITKYCKKTGLAIGLIDRKKEPNRAQIKEGASIPWKVKFLYKTNREQIPTIFYENEGWGKEPLFVLVAKNPNEVLEIMKEILAEM